MDTATTTAPDAPRAVDGPDIKGDRRSLPSLFSDLLRNTTTLVHEEVELAKADMSEKARQAARASSSIAIGGAIAFAGFLVLLGAAVAALALALPEAPPWVSPLVVGAVVLAIGLGVLASGRRRLSADSLAPTRSAASLRRDQDLVKEHLR